MAHHCIRFSFIKHEEQTIHENSIRLTLWKLLYKILGKIIPIANPDFEGRFCNVETWLVEFGDDYFPEREIGLDKAGSAIVAMPHKNNYGYWIDNNLYLKDFREHFNTIDISEKEFSGFWESFMKADKESK